MSDERKFASQTIKAYPSDWGHGSVTAKFEAERYPGSPLLDTHVNLEISPFSITWADREKLVEELKEVIAKYQI